MNEPSRYVVRGTHVPCEPHCTMVYQWQVLHRDPDFRWWRLDAVCQTEAEAIALAAKLNEEATKGDV